MQTWDDKLPQTDMCRCGHPQGEHDGSGPCSHLKPEGQEWTDSNGNRGRDCYCKTFNGAPWPWTVWAAYGGDSFIADPERPGWQRTNPDAKPQHFTVQKQNHDKTYGPYKTAAAAERRCAELNREMVQGPLDPEFIERRKRLQRLAPGGVYYLYDGRDGPPGARWPVKPDRYLVFGFADGWHGDSWVDLKPTLDAVREALADEEGNEIERVVDLDTGKDVVFERTVSVRLA